MLYINTMERSGVVSEMNGLRYTALLVAGLLMVCGNGAVSAFDGVGQPGLVSWSLPERFEEPSPLEMTVSIPGVGSVAAGDEFAITIPGQIGMPQTGAPDVPILARVAMGLSGYAARIEIEDGVYSDHDDVSVTPVPTKRLVEMPGGKRRFDEERIRDSEVYDTADFWPSELFGIREAWMGTQKVVRIECRPIQYNPVTKTLRVYSEMRARIVFDREPDRAEQ